MRKCSNCNNQINAGERICTHCGAYQTRSPQSGLVLSFIMIFAVLIFMIYSFVKLTEQQENANKYKEQQEINNNNNTNNNSNNNQNNNNQNNNKSNNKKYDTSMFENISTEEFFKILNAKDNIIRYVYTGRPSCSYCVQFIPVLQQSINNYNYALYSLDVTYITENDYNYVIEYDIVLENTFMTTPMVYAIKNGKVVNVNKGYTDYQTYSKFLENTGVKRK